MCMVKMDGPRPEGRRGVENKGATILRDHFGFLDTRYTPTYSDQKN